MKAYMFNVDSGLYEGETFDDEGRIIQTDGLTDIAPPSPKNGYVSVFSKDNQCWFQIPISVMRDHLNKLN